MHFKFLVFLCFSLYIQQTTAISDLALEYMYGHILLIYPNQEISRGLTEEYLRSYGHTSAEYAVRYLDSTSNTLTQFIERMQKGDKLDERNDELK